MITTAVEPEREQASNAAYDADLAIDAIAFDIETGPLADGVLAKICHEFTAPPHPGEFDPASVKCGNLKDKAKIEAKINEAREAHEAAVKNYDANIVTARAEHFEKFKAGAALDASTGHVVCIGTLIDGDAHTIDCDGGEQAEIDGLQHWWNLVAECLKLQRPMVGLNIHNFDLPFLVRRSWITGVPVPCGIRSSNYWSPLFVDLMRVWALGSRDMIGLNDLALAFGLPGKVKEVDGVMSDGASFWRAWRENRAVAEAYLKQDLRLPAILASKMGAV